MRFNANTQQISAFASRMRRATPAIRAAFSDSTRKTATEMAKRGKKIAPRSDDAPHIGDTITATAGDSRIYEWIVSVGSAALFYAVPLEFGHVNADGSHTPANPFWVPLTRIFKKRYVGRARRALRKALKAALGAGIAI